MSEVVRNYVLIIVLVLALLYVFHNSIIKAVDTVSIAVQSLIPIPKLIYE